MTQEQLNKWAVEQLQVIAAKLGVASDKLWELVLKQVQVDFWANIIALAFVLVSSLTCLFIAYKSNRDGAIAFTTFCFGVVFLAFFVLVSICSIDSLLTACVNPEYAALLKIMKMVGK